MPNINLITNIKFRVLKENLVDFQNLANNFNVNTRVNQFTAFDTSKWVIQDDSKITYEQYNVVVLSDEENKKLLDANGLKLTCTSKDEKWQALSADIVENRGHNGDIYLATEYKPVPPKLVITTKAFYVSGFSDAQNHM